MVEYTDEDRLSDFYYFVKNYQKLYTEYGLSYIALKDKTVLGAFKSPSEAFDTLADKYQVGTYIIQKCTGDESAYHDTINRLFVGG